MPFIIVLFVVLLAGGTVGWNLIRRWKRGKELKEVTRKGMRGETVFNSVESVVQEDHHEYVITWRNDSRNEAQSWAFVFNEDLGWGDRVSIIADVPSGQAMWAAKKFAGVTLVKGFWPHLVVGLAVFNVTIHVRNPGDVTYRRRRFPRCPFFGW